MIRKTASDLQVGDTFYRETYRQPDPETDRRYTVTRLQRVPQHDFFGKVSLMIEVQAQTTWGPSRFTLGLDEPVWVVD